MFHDPNTMTAKLCGPKECIGRSRGSHSEEMVKWLMERLNTGENKTYCMKECMIGAP